MTNHAMLANEVESIHRQFVYLPNEHAYTLATLYPMMSHLRSLESDYLPFIAPRLGFFSKKRGSGKTMAAYLTVRLCHNGKQVANPTPPSIVTSIHKGKSTLFFDEIDEYFGRGGGNGDMKTIFNAGYKRGAHVTKVRSDELVEENVHAPIIVAGLHSTFMTSQKMETLKSRTHAIVMEQCPPDIELDEFDEETHLPRINRLNDRLRSWGMIHGYDIIRSNVELPNGVRNRDKEIWKPLFQVADFIGGEWPARVRAAVRAYVLGDFDPESTTEITPGQELLNAVAACFGPDDEKLANSVIVERLFGMPGWWCDEWPSNKTGELNLPTQLRVFGIEKTKLYLKDGSKPNGYWHGQVLDALGEGIKDTENA